MTATEINTPKQDLIKLCKEGNFFYLCVAYALNNGYRDAIKEKKEVKFNIGDYDVEFKHDETCFLLTHKIYFARIITAYANGEVYFVGDDENEIIEDLLKEVSK